MKTIIPFILFALCLNAEVIETDKIEEIAPYVDEQTWVIFDIDDTLIESKLQLGRCMWYKDEIEKLKNLGHDDGVANDLMIPILDRVREACPVQTLEPDTSAFIQRIQKKAGAVFCLTSRYKHASASTFYQLNQVGMNFSSSAPSHFSLPNEEVHYENGILCISPHNNKGRTIRLLIEEFQKKPERIVFVDDSKKHLIDMEKEMEEEGIPCINFLYTKSHQRPYDPEVAAREYMDLLESI
jgi:hypothetical protein